MGGLSGIPFPAVAASSLLSCGSLLPSWPGAHAWKLPVWLPCPPQSGVAGRPQPSSVAYSGSHLLLQGILKMSLYLLHVHFLLSYLSSSCSQLLSTDVLCFYLYLAALYSGVPDISQMYFTSYQLTIHAVLILSLYSCYTTYYSISILAHTGRLYRRLRLTRLD